MPKTAHALRREVPDVVGLERAIEIVAWLVLIVGAGGVVLLVINAGWVGLAAAIQPGLGIVVGFLVLRALAEMIRLLKRIAGIPHSGTISGTRTHVERRCSACGSILHLDARCDICMATITHDVVVDESEDGPAEAAGATTTETETESGGDAAPGNGDPPSSTDDRGSSST